MPSPTKTVAPKAKVVAPKAKAAPKVAKTTAPKKLVVKKAEHPTYFDMIAAAITSMKNRRGSSRQAIRKYILENYNVDSVKMKTPLRLSFRNGLAKGKLCYAKKSGKGSGCFKLVPKEKEAKKPAVKKVVKKVKSATDKKKVADKKKVKAVEVTVAVEEILDLENRAEEVEIYDLEEVEIYENRADVSTDIDTDMDIDSDTDMDMEMECCFPGY